MGTVSAQPSREGVFPAKTSARKKIMLSVGKWRRVRCVCGGSRAKAAEGEPHKPSSHTIPGTPAVTQHSCQIPLDRHRIVTTEVKPGTEKSKETGQKLGIMGPSRGLHLIELNRYHRKSL